MEKLERVKRLFYLHKTSPPAMSGSLLFAMTDFEIRALRAFDSWKKIVLNLLHKGGNENAGAVFFSLYDKSPLFLHGCIF